MTAPARVSAYEATTTKVMEQADGGRAVAKSGYDDDTSRRDSGARQHLHVAHGGEMPCEMGVAGPVRPIPGQSRASWATALRVARGGDV